jgi:hypothetical protein
MMNSNVFRLLAVSLFSIALFAGCGPKDGHVQVKGKITRNGGPWPVIGSVTFACEEPAPGFDNEPASSEIAVDGSYSVSLLPGKYVLNLESWEVPPSMESPGAEKSNLPKSYAGKDRFKLEVPVGSGTLTQNFDVTGM